MTAWNDARMTNPSPDPPGPARTRPGYTSDGKAPIFSPRRLIRVRSELETNSRPWLWVRRAVLVLRGLPKTIYFNFRVLPFRQAIRLPLLVSPKVGLYDVRGDVEIRDPVRPAMVLIGFGEAGMFDFRRSRSVWQVAGRVVFEGPVRLGHGFKLSVAKSGTVTFGPGFTGLLESQVVCRDSVKFGDASGVSWHALIIDSDFHEMLPIEGAPGPEDAPIEIGDGCLVGARSTILKGVRLPHDTIVAAGSVVSRSVDEPNTVIGGNPAKTVRTGVAGWRFESRSG
jgi:acetyltransferase-like isoleucine patch superfamily enzyme